jgi:hypothetical protein
MAVGDQLPGQRGNSAVQRLIDCGSIGSEVPAGRIAVRRTCVIESAGHHETGKRSEEAGATFVIHFVEPWRAYPHRRLPSEFDSPEPALGDVKPTIH